MKPASPVIKGLPDVVYAKDQPEYIPLPAHKRADGHITTRWTLSWRERLRLLVGGSIYLEVMTFNQPLQPLRLSTTLPDFVKEEITVNYIKLAVDDVRTRSAQCAEKSNDPGRRGL